MSKLVFDTDYKIYSDYVDMVSRVVDLKGKLPVRFYSGDPDSIFILEKTEKKINLLQSSFSSERLKDLCRKAEGYFNSLANGEYLFDADTGVVIYNLKTAKELTNGFSTMPPKNDHTNIIASAGNGKFLKAYKSNTVVPIAASCQYINSYFLRPKDDKLDFDGVCLAIYMICEKFRLKHPDSYDVREAINNELLYPKRVSKVPSENLLNLFAFIEDADLQTYYEHSKKEDVGEIEDLEQENEVYSMNYILSYKRIPKVEFASVIVGSNLFGIEYGEIIRGVLYLTYNPMFTDQETIENLLENHGLNTKNVVTLERNENVKPH